MAAVGIQITKAEVHQALGICARQMFNTAQVIGQFKDWLDTQTNQNLLDLTIAQADIDVIISIMNDLGHMRQLWIGAGTQATAYDHRTFAKRAIGTGLY